MLATTLSPTPACRATLVCPTLRVHGESRTHSNWPLRPVPLPIGLHEHLYYLFIFIKAVEYTSFYIIVDQGGIEPPAYTL